MLKPTIGIEVHVELNTKSKVFSTSKNDFNDAPNVNIDEIDMAYPGTLPKINKEVVEMALKTAIALNCKINKTMHFDRKNYFYPDLPKGYQITQKETPIGYDGYILINLDNEVKKIEIDRVHIEEDTCKSIHINNQTMLNYNRAGIPLIEIVTKPVIKSSKEAVLYVEALREQLLYLGISDVKIEEGSMRCDANVSLSSTEKLGTKTEIKNIGSITNVGLSIDYEIVRQTKLIENGIVITEETRRFDDKTKTTILMRTKETGNDYRYFPEPDIATIIISEEDINFVKQSMPKMPDVLKEKYRNLNINTNNVKTILANKEICDFFEQIIEKVNPVIAANILTGEVLSFLNKKSKKLSETKLQKESFIELINLFDSGKLTSKHCKEIIPALLEKDDKLDEVVKELKIELIEDTNKLEEVIDIVIKDNATSVLDYRSGYENAFKYLMGQIMKQTKGNADPKVATQILKAKLDKKD